MAAWKRFPPAPMALRRLEHILMTAHHLTPSTEEPQADGPPPEPPSPEQLQRALDSFNARFAGKVPRV